MYLLNYYGHQWPFHQGAAAGPYPEFAQSGLGFYRPNQAMYRGNYAGNSRLGATDVTTGQIDITDPMTLLAIVGAGVGLWMLFRGARGAKRGIKKYTRRRRARRQTRQQIRRLEESI